MQKRTAAVTIAVATVVLAASLTVPAFGGPDVLGSASPNKIANKALKLAKKADARSKKALSEAQKVGAKGQPGAAGARGATGPAGPAGTPGAQGQPGQDAFGSLRYVVGPGGSTPDPDTYALDAASCPLGEQPTGGSLSPAGSELGGTDPQLGDYGAIAADLDDPADGVKESWLVWVYNATGSADVIAAAVCAHTKGVAVAARSKESDSRMALLRSLWRKQKP